MENYSDWGRHHVACAGVRARRRLYSADNWHGSPPLASPSLLASSQLSLIFLRQTAARAMSSTSRHTARPTVTHRATGGNAMF